MEFSFCTVHFHIGCLSVSKDVVVVALSSVAFCSAIVSVSGLFISGYLYVLANLVYCTVEFTLEILTAMNYVN